MIEPHLWTEDFSEMVAWYQSVLGFEVVAWFPDEDSATWCQLRRGDVELMIAVAPDPDTLSPGQGYLAMARDRVRAGGGAMSLYLRTPDADSAHQRAAEAGASVIEEIWDAWWGGRQFTVADPDGNWWTVFQPSG